MEEALPPAFLRSVMAKPKEEVIVPGENRDKTMAELSESDAWKVVKDHILRRQQELAQELRAVSGGAHSLEEVGFRFLVADKVNTFASEIISFVERSANAKRLKAEHDRG